MCRKQDWINNIGLILDKKCGGLTLKVSKMSLTNKTSSWAKIPKVSQKTTETWVRTGRII